MVTVYLGQLCLHAAADPLNRIEQHVGVELEAEGKLVVAIHVHDARRVPWAAQANLPKMCEMNNVCHMNMVMDEIENHYKLLDLPTHLARVETHLWA